MADNANLFWMITIVILLVDILVSSLFAVRNYKKNAKREQAVRLVISIVVFLAVFLLIAIILFQFWVLLGFALLNRDSDYPAMLPVSSAAQILSYLF